MEQYIAFMKKAYKSFLIILLFVSNVCFAEPLNVRTNNAGNLTYSRTKIWNGQVGKCKQFVVFDSKENGLLAMQSVIESNIIKTKTVDKFVERYTNESLHNKHIRNYANAIKKQLGRINLRKGDSEQLLPLIVFLEGGTKAFNYYFGVNNVRTKSYGRYNQFVQVTIVKHGIQRGTIRTTKCYTLRDVLIRKEWNS